MFRNVAPFMETVLRKMRKLPASTTLVAIFAVLFILKVFLVAPGDGVPGWGPIRQSDRWHALYLSALYFGPLFLVAFFGRRFSSNRKAESIRHSTSTVFTQIFTGGLISTRLALGLVFHVGVPGKIPLRGGVFSLASTFCYMGALGGLAVLWVYGRARVALMFSAYYVVCGAVLGWRGYAIMVFWVSLFCSVSKLRRRHALWCAVAMPVLLGLGYLGSAFRFANYSTSAPSFPAYMTGLVGRFGGLDYFAPVAKAVEVHGHSLWGFWPLNWPTQFNQTLFLIDPALRLARASTSLGYFYSAFGVAGLIGGGVLTGFFSRTIDSWSSGPKASRWLSGVAGCALMNFVLEGTAHTAIFIGVVASFVGGACLFFDNRFPRMWRRDVLGVPTSQ